MSSWRYFYAKKYIIDVISLGNNLTLNSELLISFLKETLTRWEIKIKKFY
jgi:hypothetical protein